MEFSDFLKTQLALHPSAQPQDVGKLCYQAARGAEHLLHDLSGAQAYLLREFEATPAAEVPLFEAISLGVARVNLSAWKAAGLPVEWLFRMFAASATIDPEGEARFVEYLATADAMLREQIPGWSAWLSAYKAAGTPPVHHSEAYRKAEHPAYRIISARFVRLIPILQKLPASGIIAIDGRAASGKSTLAADLQTVLNAEVIHMDDFFLPPALRSAVRLSTPGGNVHSERFLEEVLPGLKAGCAFTYRIFDCSQMDFHGSREISAAPYRIVEGSYSHHPDFGRYADVTVFSDIDGKTQLQRILVRNGEAMLRRFETEWIPMEEQYFEAFGIRKNADICV